MENKTKIGVKQVLQHLKDGMTREDIAQHYSITMGECKQLFQHPQLKNKKTIKKPSFIIVDDEAEEIATPENIADTPVLENVVPETTTDTPTEETVDDVTLAPSNEEVATENFGTTTTDEVAEEVAAIPEENTKATWD